MLSSAQRAGAAAALRALLRAQRVTFANDPAARTAASQLNRRILAPLREPQASPADIDQAIIGAREAAVFFRSNVVQGQRNDANVYRLRVTKDTELRTGVPSSAGCCS